MNQTISNLKRHNPDLKKAEIIGLLYIINSKERLTNNDLIKMTGVPKNILKEFKASISEYLLKTDENNIEINETGLEIFSQLDLIPYKWSLVDYDLKEYEDKIVKIREKYQMVPSREYDQFFATPKSTVSKAKMLIEKGVVKGKKIALIGDDDLVSIALGLMSPNFSEIKIFEIDEKITSNIKKIIDEYGIKNIKTIAYDAREDLPENENANYDVVLIDPPYTQQGVQVFLHRVVELLKKKKNFSGSYIFLNFGVGLRNPDIKIKIQDVINHYNLVIEDKINKFTRYEGAETVGSASSLYILKTTQFTTAENVVLSDTIYTFQKTDLENFPYVDHYVFKLQRVPSKILKSKNQLNKKMGEFCNRHSLKVVDTKITKFQKQGISITYIIATSNLILHTWPESSSLHMDLITCSPIKNKQKMGETLQKLFETNVIEVKRIE